jgi:hypothetical protein
MVAEKTRPLSHLIRKVIMQVFGWHVWQVEWQFGGDGYFSPTLHFFLLCPGVCVRPLKIDFYLVLSFAIKLLMLLFFSLFFTHGYLGCRMVKHLNVPSMNKQFV